MSTCPRTRVKNLHPKIAKEEQTKHLLLEKPLSLIGSLHKIWLIFQLTPPSSQPALSSSNPHSPPNLVLNSSNLLSLFSSPYIPLSSSNQLNSFSSPNLVLNSSNLPSPHSVLYLVLDSSNLPSLPSVLNLVLNSSNLPIPQVHPTSDPPAPTYSASFSTIPTPPTLSDSSTSFRQCFNCRSKLEYTFPTQASSWSI